MVERISRWMAKNAPKREELAKSRWMKPFGSRVLHSEFWRFTRRSVPRGVAVGLFVGIFALIPGIQIIGAALLSIPFRANIPVAAAMTFLTNPPTTPSCCWRDPGRATRSAPRRHRRVPGREAPAVGEWMGWLFSDAAPASVTGLFIIALVTGALGYFLSMLDLALVDRRANGAATGRATAVN